jgi:PAS domain S-box-containing protein
LTNTAAIIISRHHEARERKRAEEALADEFGTMTRLHDLAERLLSITDLPAAMGEVLGAAIAFYAADRGTIQIYDADMQLLRYAASRGFDVKALGNIPPVDRDFHSTCAVALRTGERVVATDMLGDPRWADHVETAIALDYRAAISSPMKTRRDELLGVLTVHFRQPHAPSERELGWADLYTRLAAHVIERGHAEAALRASEARFRRAISVPAVGVLFFDLAGHMHEANEAFQHMCGYTLDELQSMRHWDHLTAPEFYEATSHRARDLAERGETPPYEKEMIRKDGTRRWGLFAPTRLSGHGSESECVEFVIDITDTKHAQEALRDSEQRLRAAVGERDVLLKELHHRVKNNLQVITSLLEMQARQTSDAPALASLSEARNRITAIATIHELLYQSGSFSDVDLGAYAGRLVQHVVSLYDPESRISASVSGDGLRMDLARAVPFGLLLNELVSNAYKHAFRSGAGGELRIALDRDNGFMRLRVSDTGVGLPGDFNERPLATLGLQLVRMLTKQLGGTVMFESTRGTSVDVLVPLEEKSP